jgi:ABC-type glycerol-3-phosphate transport system permease component
MTADKNNVVTSTRAAGERMRTGGHQSFRGWVRRSDLLMHLIMVVVLFIIFLPLIWMISTSFKGRLEFATNPAGLIPWDFSLVNYRYMFSSIELLPVYMRNSFILAFGTAAIQVFVSSLAGYAFARMRFRGRDLIFAAMLISIFIPKTGGLMALYELMAFLHLRNSLFGLTLLFASTVPVSIFIMRQTFLAIPKEIEEAALVDGAGWFTVFWRIALPLASGGMVIVATLAVITSWSDYLITYTMIDRDDQMTISVGIQKLLASSYETSLAPRFRNQLAGEAADAAMLLFATLPVIIFYAVLQRWFMKGLIEGAVK